MNQFREIKPGTMIVKRGMTVQCPKCFLEIAELNYDLRKGMTIESGLFSEKIPGAVLNGGPMCCPKCLEGYYLMGKLFIKELGWVP